MLKVNKASWIALALIASFFRWWLTADLVSTATYSPHDSSLYVQRASWLLTDGTFGPWTERTLIKLPGFSYLIAGFAALGLDYETWALGLWILSAAFLAWSVRRWLRRSWQQFALFVFLSFHPISFDAGFDVFREKVALSLGLVLIAASIEIVATAWAHQRQRLWVWFVWASMFAILRLTREEDRSVLWIHLVVMSSVLLLINRRIGAERIRLLSLMVIPILMTFTMDEMARRHIQASYGLPLLHDLSQGAYPRLIGALRALPGSEQNRHVMLPQEVLSRGSGVASELAPIIAAYPKPSQDSYSCQRFGVCSEITNGWSVFFLKDAFQFTGHAPSLLSSQALYERTAALIEESCKRGEGSCVETPRASLLRPPSWRWLPFTVEEFFSQWKLIWDPGFTTPPPPKDQTEDVEIQRAYRHVISDGRPRLSESRWPAAFREAIRASARPLTQGLLILGVVVALVLFFNRTTTGDLRAILLIVLASLYARLAGLAFAATTMGSLDGRLYFFIHLILALIGLAVLMQASEPRRVRMIWCWIQNRWKVSSSLRSWIAMVGYIGCSFCAVSALASPSVTSADDSQALLSRLLELQARDGQVICTPPQVDLGVWSLISLALLVVMVGFFTQQIRKVRGPS